MNKLFTSHGLQRYFKNTSWLFAEKILRLSVGLFVGVWVARFLGPEEYGLMNYAQSFVALFSAFATLGLDGIVIRELVKNKGEHGKLIGTSFTLKITASIILYLTLMIISYLVIDDYTARTLVFIFALIPILQSLNVIDFYFKANVLSKYTVIANSISMLISSILKIILILNNADLIYFVWVICFDTFLIGLGLIYLYLRKSSTIQKWKFDKTLAVNLIKDSWPLMFSGLVISIYMKIDQVMLKEMIDSQAVGYYAAAVRLSEAVAFLPLIISSSVFPAIINAKIHSEELYNSRLQKLYDLMVITTILIAIVISLLSERIIATVYGDSYMESSKVLFIYVWGGIFTALLVSSGKWFVTENLAKYALMRNLLGAFLNIVLNIVLIPKYGISGAAIASVISFFFAGYLFDVFTKKTFCSFVLKTNSLNIFSYYSRYKSYLSIKKGNK